MSTVNVHPGIRMTTPSRTVGIPVTAVAEWEALAGALERSGVRPRCSGRGEDFDAFPDTDAAERAAARCWTCPVQPECLAFGVANGERHGVWGGTNFHGPGPRSFRHHHPEGPPS